METMNMKYFKNNLFILLIIFCFLLQVSCTAIVVGAGTAVAIANDNRTAGDILEDENIEIKFINKIDNSEKLADKVHINATSYNGWVLLTGETPTEAMRQSVYNLAANIKNVKRVFNEIIIAQPSSFSVRSNDTYITSKIITKLLANPKTEVYNVKVVTENSIVYLMGLISEEQAKEIVKLIQPISGITRIIKLFDYPYQQ